MSGRSGRLAVLLGSVLFGLITTSGCTARQVRAVEETLQAVASTVSEINAAKLEEAVEDLMDDPEWAASLGQSIQSITHPTGSFVKVGGWEVARDGPNVVLEIRVFWQGGFLGNDYNTIVAWTFTEHGHGRAVVTRDTALMGISASNLERLNAYFRDTVWPAVREAANE